MGTHGGAEPLVGLEVNLVFCFVDGKTAIPWERKHKKMTLSDETVIKHALCLPLPPLLLLLLLPPPLPIGNIWTFGRKQAIRLQLDHFSCKHDQSENLNRRYVILSHQQFSYSP